jgi:hypothetical protein
MKKVLYTVHDSKMEYVRLPEPNSKRKEMYFGVRLMTGINED